MAECDLCACVLYAASVAGKINQAFSKLPVTLGVSENVCAALC